MLKPLSRHKGRRYPTSVLWRGHEQRGRMGVVKTPGPVYTRIGELTPDGEIAGISHLVPSGDVYDPQPIPQNQLRSPMTHHAGRKAKEFLLTCLVRGKGKVGRHYIVGNPGYVDTRVIAIDASGKSSGFSFLVASRDAYDREPVPQEVVMDERGVAVLPAVFREIKKIAGRWIVEIVVVKDGFLIRPLRPA
jgi:hypothetical protein